MPVVNLHFAAVAVTFVSAEQQPVPVVNLHFAAVAVTSVSAEQQPVPVVNRHFAAVAVTFVSAEQQTRARRQPALCRRREQPAPVVNTFTAGTHRTIRTDDLFIARRRHQPTRLPCPCRLHLACSTTLLRRRRLPDRATMPTSTPHRLLC